MTYQNSEKDVNREVEIKVIGGKVEYQSQVDAILNLTRMKRWKDQHVIITTQNFQNDLVEFCLH